jgi:hypothetical protein
LSLAYGIPVRELMTKITSQEFTELKAFRKMHSLAPATWQATSRLASLLYCGQTGTWINPDQFRNLE